MSTAITPLNYETITRDTIQKLHQNFIDGIEKKARAAIPSDAKNVDEVLAALMQLLIESTRKAIDIKKDELAVIAKCGMDVIKRRTESIEKTLHTRCVEGSWPSPAFTPKQKQEHEASLKKRKEHERVQAVFGEEDRLYLRVKEPDGKPGDFLSDTHRQIDAFLKSKGYNILDYRKGYATDAKGKQQFKIGKLIKDEEHLYKAFSEDSARASSELMVVISRNKDDLAYMSTGRAWGSCMGSNGVNYHYVPQDIEKGSLIAYLVSEKDPDVTNPLGRILIKPFVRTAEKRRRISTVMNLPLKAVTREITTAFNQLVSKWLGHQDDPQPNTIFVPGTSYGIHNEAFKKTVLQFVENQLNHGISGRFYLTSGLYQDNLDRYQDRHGDVTKPGGYW